MTAATLPAGLFRRLAGSPFAALGATATQALTSFMLMAVAARNLGIDELGTFSILYGILILAAALTTGFVGDTLTVLDRFDPYIRAALSRWLGVLALAAAGFAFVGTWGIGLLTPGEAALFGAATLAYLLEDILRRVFSATLSFHRLIAVDTTALVSSLVALVVLLNVSPLGVGTFVTAVLTGQMAAMIAGVLLLAPRERVIGSEKPAWRIVGAYGFWRAAQQCLRPGALTAVRVMLAAIVGFAAAGELELARTYCAPAMLLVTGACSYIFPSLAREGRRSLADLLRKTDRNVGILLALTGAAAATALTLLPVAGPVITGAVPDMLAVTGWLAYAAAVGGATPYGQLAAIRGRPRPVFVIRLGDTLVSLLLVALVIEATGDFRWVPLACAGGTALGGMAIRALLLAPQVRRRQGPRVALPEALSELASAAQPLNTYDRTAPKSLAISASLQTEGRK